MKGPIKAVIFDLGNVLVDFDHRIAVKKIAGFSDKTQQEIYDFFFDSSLTGIFEEGKIASVDFFAEVKMALNLKIGFEKFLPIWNEIFFLNEKNQAVYLLVKELKARYKVGLLSNINELHYAYLRENFPVFDAFDELLLSFELKAKKPDPLIYRKALKRMGVNPEELFYTDDRPDLISASRSLGINGFVFQGVEQLRRDLIACGII